MKLYYDEQLLNEVAEKSDIDFDRVEVGEVKTLTLWLSNNLNSYVENIKFSLTEVASYKEVQIDCPKSMKPKSKSAVIISWKPTLKVEAGLKGIKWEVIGTNVWE